ncbi:MAG: two-component regulator propeller domain-containing protein [Chloroflexota bacterium]
MLIKNINKKTIILFLALFMILLTACGGSNGDDGVADADDGVPQVVEEDGNTAVDEPTDEPEPTNEPEPTPEPAPTDEPEPEPTEEPVEEPSEEPTAEPAEEEPAEEQPAAVEASGAGFACFGTSGEGLNCLTQEGEWVAYTQDNSDLYIDFISSLDECNGEILIGLSSSLAIFDGATFRNFPDREDFGSNEAAVCDADGNVWVAHFRGVSVYDGSTWTTYDENNFGGETLLLDIAVSPNGDIWVLSTNTIARFNGADWELFTEGSGLSDTYFFKNLIIDHLGVVWASYGGGLLVFGEGVWTEKDSGSFLTPQALASDKSGNIYLGTFADGMLIFDQSTWQTVSLSSGQVEAIEVDDNDRIWVGTEYGLNVRDGDTWQVYRMDNANLTSNRFVEVVVIGEGPALPAPVDKAPGSLTGFFTLDGAPYADTIVEICVEELYSSFNGPTPCSEQPYSQQTVTDENGVFTFEDVPVGLYSIVVQTGDSWAKYSGEFSFGSEFVSVLPNEQTDIGELIITLEEEG